MRRREFIAGLGGAAAWPLVVRAQQPGKVYRIGFLANDPTIPKQAVWSAFLEGLHKSGFSEGQNVAVERRFAEGRLDRYDELVAELISLGVDVIVSSGAATEHAKRATKSVPIVMLNVTDPVREGLIASLAHPGGNITGVIADDTAEIATKRMQLLKDAVPGAAQVAVLINPDNYYTRDTLHQLELAAPALKLTLRPVVARQVSEFENAIAGLERDRPDAMLVTGSGLNFTNRQLIMDLALKSRLPAMSSFKESTEAGGLMSYGIDRIETFHGAGIYVGKILKGAKPADLPVEGPTKYELVINLKTAKALNLEISRSLQLLADEVIE